MIHELINDLYFYYEFLPIKNDKKYIINKLHRLNDTKQKVNLNCFITKFYILDNLLNLLIKDPNIQVKDKKFINELLFESKKRQEKMQSTIYLQKD